MINISLVDDNKVSHSAVTVLILDADCDNSIEMKN